MKYCIEYRNYFGHKEDDAIEFKIKYNNHDEGVEDFLKQWPNKRITIEINDFENFIIESKEKIYIGLIKAGITNFVFKFYEEDIPKELLELFIQNNIPFYFANPVTSWDKLHSNIEKGVTDVLVAEEICFNMKAIAKICHSKNVNVRVIPNVCQSSAKDIPSLKKFFIRPEALPIYETLIDVVEFYNEENRAEALYEIYSQLRKWYGPLNELILGLDDDIDSRAIVPDFDNMRVKCDKKCMKGKHCEICELTKVLAKTLVEHDIMVELNNN